ncbi:helix-hairpin-helix domain-containing protein [Plebeiibacterium sediminum]|uniref:Helix-hairpin-helix domain-containing protein n=1 Tax=Plebeiibacterium sediminum TaxID=2992112 RepID=A0AAE3SEG7_9BACT|nr:helix-hairpin-helix domain-containing protein [Plebeiobacterium sediminum]MCW3786211.1 helix-hairpin-helix domain-containing protein [Plebeiobacterium sediminum]
MMWKDFFYYSRNEQKGIVVLLIIVAIVIVVRIILPFLVLNPQISEDQKQFLSQIDKINLSLSEKEIRHDSLFFFDPNTVSKLDMKMLGFSSYQINSLLGYRSKVGQLSSINDLQKVYGVDSVFINKYKAFIHFDEVKIRQEQKDIEDDIVWINFNKVADDFWYTNVESNEIRDTIIGLLHLNYIAKSLPNYKVKEFTDEKLLLWLRQHSKVKYQKQNFNSQIELNSANASALKEVRGIGEVLSKRILKYGNLLGGYTEVKQLQEVYGVTEELYNKICSSFTVDAEQIHKIDLINTKISEVCKHPYFNYKQTVELKNLMRKGVDIFEDQELVFENISDEEWNKMKMYLKSDSLNLNIQ